MGTTPLWAVFAGPPAVFTAWLDQRCDAGRCDLFVLV